MSKSKEFLENYKLKKAVGDFKPSLNYGDKLNMFSCMYKVVSHKDEGYTILEDEKNSRVAIPSSKLALLMKTGLVKNYGMLNLAKGFVNIGGSSAKVGVTPRSVNASLAETPNPGGRGPKGEPVGTVKTGSDGQSYKKVSDHPSKWVHVGKGTSHAAPGAQEDNPLSHEEDQKKFLQIRSVITSKTPAAEHEKLTKLAMDWVSQLHKFKNLKSMHNAGDVDQKGNKLPKSGITANAFKNVMDEKDKADRMKKQLIDAIVAARKG